jgi:hypothetical protein
LLFSPAGRVIIESGEHIYPFKFTLPLCVPPTSLTKHYTMTYSVTSKIDSIKGQAHNMVTQPLNLFIEYAKMKDTGIRISL